MSLNKNIEQSQGKSSAALPTELFDLVLDRLKTATNSRNPAELARALGLSSQSVYPVLEKKETIPPSWLLRAWTLGASVDWVLSGDGPKERILRTDALSNSQVDITLDSMLLTDILSTVKIVQDEEEQELPPQKEAEAVSLLYQYYYGREELVEKETVRKYLHLAVA